MQGQQIAFEDWEAEADKIEIVEQPVSIQNAIPKAQSKNDSFPFNQNEINIVQELRNISNSQFQNRFKDKNEVERVIKKSPLLLKCENDFVELSKIVSSKLKIEAIKNEDKVLPEAQLYTFFQELLQYLYPNLEWENVQFMKQKLKIMKKNRKEEQNRARKLRQKDQRLKKSHKGQQMAKQTPQDQN